jgi:predicted  nucleic acid-binding Zn-ribbon protein
MGLTSAERQRRYIDKLKAGSGSDALKDRIADLERQVARLRAKIVRLEAERTVLRGGDLAAMLTAANQRNAELKRENAELRKQMRTGTWMSAELVREIRSALHPDRAVRDPARRKRLTELSQQFNGGLSK